MSQDASEGTDVLMIAREQSAQICLPALQGHR